MEVILSTWLVFGAPRFGWPTVEELATKLKPLSILRLVLWCSHIHGAKSSPDLSEEDRKKIKPVPDDAPEVIKLYDRVLTLGAIPNTDLSKELNRAAYGPQRAQRTPYRSLMKKLGMEQEPLDRDDQVRFSKHFSGT